MIKQYIIFKPTKLRENEKLRNRKFHNFWSIMQHLSDLGQSKNCKHKKTDKKANISSIDNKGSQRTRLGH